MDRSIGYKNSRSTPPAPKGSEGQVHGVRSIQVSPTPEIRGNNKHSPELTKTTDKRAVEPIEPTSYIREFYDTAETMLSGGREALNVSKAFFIDLGISTAETFKSAWNSVDQGVPEMLKFTGGVVTLGSALTQATVAGIAEVAEGLGYDVANESVDGVSYFLKQAGIKTTGLTKTELRQLGTSLAALHFGFSQDIHLKNAKFEIKQGSGYKLNISNLQVKNLVPANIGQTDLKESDQLTTSADELSFTLEYLPETGQPTKLNVCIPSPKLRGETNLLMVMGEAAASCCQGNCINPKR